MTKSTIGGNFDSHNLFICRTIPFIIITLASQVQVNKFHLHSHRYAIYFKPH